MYTPHENSTHLGQALFSFLGTDMMNVSHTGAEVRFGRHTQGEKFLYRNQTL